MYGCSSRRNCSAAAGLSLARCWARGRLEISADRSAGVLSDSNCLSGSAVSGTRSNAISSWISVRSASVEFGIVWRQLRTIVSALSPAPASTAICSARRYSASSLLWRAACSISSTASAGWLSRNANSASNNWYNSGPSRYELSTTCAGSCRMVGTEAGPGGGSAAFFCCAQAPAGASRTRPRPSSAWRQATPVARAKALGLLRFKPCV